MQPLPPIATPEEVLDFWFGTPAENEEELMTRARRWFQGGPDFDREVNERFRGSVEAALRGELDHWANTARGRLALVILLDQFTRNAFRGDVRTYEGDAKAQALAVDAFARGVDAELDHLERVFLSMPLLHAESLALHEKLGELLDRLTSDAPLYARMREMHREQVAKYRDIVQRFGRFPHRNALLGRTSTAEELEFLQDWAERMAPRGMRS